MQFIPGQKLKLADILDTQTPFLLDIELNTPVTMDVALFGLDAASQLSDEAYMIFYNQPKSPCGAIAFSQRSPSRTTFSINLPQLNPRIERLMVTLAIDSTQLHTVMSQLNASKLTLLTAAQVAVATFEFDGGLFDQERAIMLFEIYKKDGIWRASAVAQGFNGGLDKLIEHFGGEVAQEIPVNATDISTGTRTGTNTASPTITPDTTATPPSLSKIDLKKKISLEKAQKTGNPQIIDLTKKSLVQLEKKNLLDVQARVALVLDASGSMNWQYKNGDVQKVVNRLLPLAISFDNDGSFECWAFAQHTTQLDDVTLHNVSQYIETTHGGWKNWQVGARVNAEIPAIQAVMDFYTGVTLHNSTANTERGFFAKLLNPSTPQFSLPADYHPQQSQLPVYVLFISDGGVGNSKQMQNILTQAAHLPIFWQFVGIGGQDYGVLEKLDDMTGRVVDNCNFFDLDSIASVSDEKLYELLLEEFPDWLTAAKQQGIVT